MTPKNQEFIETLEGGLLEHVASNTDLEKVRAALKADMEKVKAELSVKIEFSKGDLLRWLFGAWVTLFPAILVLFLKFP